MGQVQYIINSTPATGECRLYNLSDDFIEVFSIHIEPIRYTTNINGFNEVTASSMWLLENNNISITIDESQTFILNKSSVGRSVTYPIIYRRNGLAKKTLNIIENGIAGTIQPLYGNDSTQFGSDYIRSINNTKYQLTVINSLPSSGSTIINKAYFLNHLINTNQNDYLTFNVNIIPQDQPTINLIQSKLNDCRFIVQKSVYNKQVTNGIELLYQNTFTTQPNDFGIKY